MDLPRFYKLHPAYGKRQFAAKNDNTKVGAVTSIHKAALWQCKFGRFPLPAPVNRDITSRAKSTSKWTYLGGFVVIFQMKG
jgi:hypothetical protein